MIDSVNSPLINHRLDSLEEGQRSASTKLDKITERLDLVLERQATEKERVTHHDGRLNNLEANQSRAGWAVLSGAFAIITSLGALIFTLIKK